MKELVTHKARRHQREPCFEPVLTSRDIKLQQCAKIAELRRALLAAGFVSLDSQTVALGLGRSTTWSILRACHKSTGLTGSVIKRILNSAQLPAPARSVIEQYIAQKSAGAYGHDRDQIRRFRERLGLNGVVHGKQRMEMSDL
jgi:hypothetical protein